MYVWIFCVCELKLEPVCVWVSDCERACRWISIIAWCKMAHLSQQDSAKNCLAQFTYSTSCWPCVACRQCRPCAFYSCAYEHLHDKQYYALKIWQLVLAYRKLWLLSAYYLLSACPLLVISYCLLSACA